MTLKDSVLAWFVKEYIIPNAQILDKPGFIAFNISGKNQLKVRQIIAPEKLFINIESDCIRKLGDEGKKKLYSAGKKFGYSFAIMGGFITKKQTTENKILDYLKLVNKFIEGTYASLIEGQAEYAKSKVVFYLKNFVVCNRIGEGYFLPLGAGTGLIARLMDDVTIEGIHFTPDENNTRECIVVCAPPEVLRKEYPNEMFFTESNLDGLDVSAYYGDYNKIVDIQSSTHSFRKYLESGLFTYDHGIVMYKEDRYFIFEVTGLYLLSISLETDAASEKILFQSAYDAGKEIIQKYGFDSKNIQSLIDLLTAHGWGDITIAKQNGKVMLGIKHFPWTKYFHESKFTLFSGFFSGIISGFAKREIIFKKCEKNVESGYFEVIFFE